jgi:hypothetical protein
MGNFEQTGFHARTRRPRMRLAGFTAPQILAVAPLGRDGDGARLTTGPAG